MLDYATLDEFNNGNKTCLWILKNNAIKILHCATQFRARPFRKQSVANNVCNTYYKYALFCHIIHERSS